MEKALDKINKAFSGEMGDVFKDKTRQRVFWMMSKVQGKNVLDIGCSQGITSILLGREGKKVIGVDALSESIQIANDELMQEEPDVRENVKFISANIVTTDLEFNKFNTIIMGEILEHLSNCDDLLKRAWELGESKSRCIITVPFGINDYFDHKKTYYYGNLLQDINPYYEIEEKVFLGKWLGLVLTRKDKIEENNKLLIPINDLLNEEGNFYSIEREAIDKISELNRGIINRNIQIKDINNKLITNKESYEKELKELKAELITNKESYEKELKELKSELAANKECYYKESGELKDELLINKEGYEKELRQLKSELITNKERYEKEVKKLNIQLMDNKNNYEKELNEIINRYASLIESKDKEILSLVEKNNIINIELERCSDIINEKKNVEIQSLTEALNNANVKYRSSIKNEEKYKEKIEIIQNENKTLKSKLNILVERELNIFRQIEPSLLRFERDYNNIVKDHEKLKKQYNNINSKYLAISSSKLGRLTTAYWRYKKGRSKKKC